MEQLKTGLWYRPTTNKTNSIYFLKNTSNNSLNPHYSYGISGSGRWSELMNRNLKEFIPAEERVVSDALKREAIKRFTGKKIKCLTGGYPIGFTGVAINFYFKDNDMWSDGALIYRNGKWADAIDIDTKIIIQETHYEIY